MKHNKQAWTITVLLLASLGFAQINNGGSGGGGTGGTSPTQPAYLVTASPYNAACNGSTDDTTAIQSAITAASTAHGTVIFPQGTCKITSALTVAAGTTNLGIQGQIGYGSQISQATASADIFDFNGTVGSPINTLTINNMVFARSVAFTGTPNGLNFTYCQNCNLNYVQVFGSYTNYSTTNGANDIWTYITSGQGSATTVNAGISVNGATNSLFLEEVLTNGTHSIGLNFTGSAVDTFVYHLSTTGSVATGISIGVAASDVHIIEPILDSCGTVCINVTGSTGGVSGVTNNIQIVDCWCNNTTGNVVLISGSEGVHLVGGTFVQRAASAANSIYFSGSTRNSIVGAHVINAGGNNVNSAIVSTGTDNLIASNIVSAATGHGWNNGIYLSSTSANNTITGNSITGFGVAGLTTDSTASSPNTFSGNIIDPANITTPVLDILAGQVYTGTTLASGVVGDAQGYKSTASITGPVPVKWDTSNANQVVTTVTTDTGAGVPIGVCVNSPSAGQSCLVMTKGTVALKLGTGTCAIGNFVIVDTTTNGDVKCTSTYTAGTVIGTAQAANSSVGTAFNVALGLR